MSRCIYLYTQPINKSTVALPIRLCYTKGIEANIDKRILSYNIVNTIGDKDLRALRRPNKGRKYTSNSPKDRNNRAKRLAILSRYPSR